MATVKQTLQGSPFETVIATAERIAAIGKLPMTADTEKTFVHEVNAMIHAFNALNDIRKNEEANHA